jgi:glycosyltransferase involved in cell wall biosynthesis
MPSIYEGFPMVIMESMAHGVIPITTDVGGINEHITNGENGILISDGNEEKIVFDFINAIELLIIDNKKMEIISKNAFEYAQSHFSIEQFNDNYRRLFSS